MAINITAKGDPEKKLKWAFKMSRLKEAAEPRVGSSIRYLPDQISKS